MEIKLYTDGSALSHNKEYIGGWGVIIVQEGEENVILTGSKFPSTNNEMELFAIMTALKWSMEKHTELPEATFIIYSDSQYSLSSITDWMYGWAMKGWITSSKAPVKNLELMKEFYQLLRFPLPYVKFEKVKGHSGHFENDAVDGVAVASSTELKKKILAGG